MEDSTKTTKTERNKDINDGTGNENVRNGPKEHVPLLDKREPDKEELVMEPVLLTKEMEEELIGPDSFVSCGIGQLTSGWLQRFARPETYLVTFSLTAFAQGIFFTYSTGTISTIERRFGLPSSVSGFISTGNDVLNVLVSLHLAYAAGYGHRPRWLGGGLLLSAIGSFVIMSPHFIFGAGDYSSLSQVFVDHSRTNNITADVNKDDWNYCGKEEGMKTNSCKDGAMNVGLEQYTVAILQFLGQAMSGLANVCFYVVGYSYLDEAVRKDQMPFYFAVAGCMRIFGPVAGSGLASYTVSRWIELGVDPVIKPTHPQWVGAWWLGYPIIMLFLVTSSVPMMMMPRQLPGMRERTKTKMKAAAKQGKEAFEAYKASLRPLGTLKFRDMIPGLIRLSKNKIFVIITTNQTVFWLGVVGYFMFELKYMENQFKISAADANKTMALAGIVASMVGWLATGSLLTLLKPSSKNIIYSTMAISLCCVASYLCQMSITCQIDHVIGLDAVVRMEEPNTDYSAQKDNEDLVTCLTNCNCDNTYSPVCVNDTHQFFSACHAGCTQKQLVNGSLMFEECSCVSLVESTNEEVYSTASGEIRNGACTSGCDKFKYYVIFSVMSKMFVSANRVIANVLVFRSVDEKDKDLALGILNVILSIAFVSVPIFMGSLLDYSCVLWQRKCDRRGYCYLYDMDKYRYIQHLVPAICVFLGFLTEALFLKYHEQIDFFGTKELEQFNLTDFIKKKKKKKKQKQEQNSKTQYDKSNMGEGEEKV